MTEFKEGDRVRDIKYDKGAVGVVIEVAPRRDRLAPEGSVSYRVQYDNRSCTGLYHDGELELAQKPVSNATGQWYWITKEQAADLRSALARTISAYPLAEHDERMFRQLAEALAP